MRDKRRLTSDCARVLNSAQNNGGSIFKATKPGKGRKRCETSLKDASAGTPETSRITLTVCEWSTSEILAPHGSRSSGCRGRLLGLACSMEIARSWIRQPCLASSARCAELIPENSTKPEPPLERRALMYPSRPSNAAIRLASKHPGSRFRTNSVEDILQSKSE